MGHVFPSRDFSLLWYHPCNGADITLSLVHAWYVLFPHWTLCSQIPSSLPELQLCPLFAILMWHTCVPMWLTGPLWLFTGMCWNTWISRNQVATNCSARYLTVTPFPSLACTPCLFGGLGFVCLFACFCVCVCVIFVLFTLFLVMVSQWLAGISLHVSAMFHVVNPLPLLLSLRVCETK